MFDNFVRIHETQVDAPGAPSAEPEPGTGVNS